MLLYTAKKIDRGRKRHRIERTMYCSNCGAKLAGVFCSACGQRTGEPPTNVNVQNVYRGKNLQIWGVLIGLAGLVCLIGTWPANFDASFAGLWIGIVLVVVGAFLAATGKAQHWYHAE